MPEDAASDGRALAEILSETVARGLLFILITVDDDLNAYTVFETLNARGLELTTTDLLKNYLFSKVRASGDLDMLQRRWSQLIDIVEAPRFPDFLRYHLLCSRPRVRRRIMFKLVRDESDAAGRPCHPESDPGTIEHILPENPVADWDDSFPRRSQDAAVWRLGNLTLLEQGANRDVGNDAYSAKIPVYANSRYALAKAIPEMAPDGQAGRASLAGAEECGRQASVDPGENSGERRRLAGLHVGVFVGKEPA